MEIEYKETLEKTIYKSSLKAFIIELENTYRRNSGWVVGDIKTEELNSEQLKVTVPLTKYLLNEDNDTYREMFVRPIKTEELDSIIASLKEEYTSEDGWTVDTPNVTEIGNGEIILRVPLEQKRKGLNL